MKTLTKAQEDLPEIYRTVFYKVVMMGGREYRLDPEELQVVKLGMSKGGFIQIKQALINVSSISSIEVDEVRTRDWRKEFMDQWEWNQRDPENRKPLPEPKLLENPFKRESRASQQIGTSRT